MHITPFKALYPHPQRLAEESTLFDTVKEKYLDFEQAGFFLSTTQEAIFLYEIVTPQHRHLGLLACTDVENYLHGFIKKHEHTILQQEQKQMRLILERKAVVKPVLLTYSTVPELDDWMHHYKNNHPVFFENHFEKDNQTHRLWAIENRSAIENLQFLFAQYVSQVYIADGHHRIYAMALLSKTVDNEAIKKKYRQVYCAFFAAAELEINAFHRLVEVPEHFDLAVLKNIFEITPLSEAASPVRPHELTLGTPQGWYKLHWKANVLQEFIKEAVVLDTVLLNEKVLQALFKIQDVRNDRRVQYVEATKGLNYIESKITARHWGFCLHPISFDDLTKLVASGGTLPPKSTWFEPRMKNGLLVKPY